MARVGLIGQTGQITAFIAEVPNHESPLPLIWFDVITHLGLLAPTRARAVTAVSLCQMSARLRFGEWQEQHTEIPTSKRNVPGTYLRYLLRRYLVSGLNLIHFAERTTFLEPSIIELPVATLLFRLDIRGLNNYQWSCNVIALSVAR